MYKNSDMLKKGSGNLNERHNERSKNSKERHNKRETYII